MSKQQKEESIGMCEYSLAYLMKLQSMAGIDENAYGPHLISVLKNRKEIAKRMLNSGLISEENLKGMQSMVDYYNKLICQILSM